MRRAGAARRAGPPELQHARGPSVVRAGRLHRFGLAARVPAWRRVAEFRDHGPRRTGRARRPPRAANQRRLFHGAPGQARARPILYGRRGGVDPSVIIINETAGAAVFPEGGCGRPFDHGWGAERQVAEQRIVGVVADIKDGPPTRRQCPQVHSIQSDGLRPRYSYSQAEQLIFPSLVSAIRQVRPGLVVRGRRR